MGVYDYVLAADRVVAELRAAALAGRAEGKGFAQSWLFVGPPGSGRSVAALSFAAALQCQAPEPGCGECRTCRSVFAGSHPDVRRLNPQGLSISVAEIREATGWTARLPASPWRILLVEDADRLTESATNALLKAVEEPSSRAVFLLCAPSVDPHDIAVTLRSRCRLVSLGAPSREQVAKVLVERDGVDASTAQWAASVSAGHVGRARRLARDEAARDRRAATLALPLAMLDVRQRYDAAVRIASQASEEAAARCAALDAQELADLKEQLGVDGPGKAARAAQGAVKELERKQKLRATRVERDALDGVLVDLLAYYRDALAWRWGAPTPALCPDVAEQVRELAERRDERRLLAAMEAILGAREAIAANVKPKVALTAMVSSLAMTS
ncbi:AAA ATPase [Segniliparus rotundus DSM 44985]|uniref:AAA ATPase n=1 Tax=Segniliparus rotundus (strain ATCC BAA-972 / CDC 1076 / CIP 108378 / DSM 44985 / JCM 13578) TaxID=640132 RepID=D6ZAH9_SEGRD|nr:DNA polymerase III subunit delta' [Segniliparus rotundus]ADG96721.1 AAA ATPase [Segniliparus rotundus DSM 44985]